MVARGNLAEDARTSAGEDEEGGGYDDEEEGASRFPPDPELEAEDEEGPSRRSSRRKVRERRSLQLGLEEENQAAGAPCVTVHLHMVVELGTLWRRSGAGAC